MDKNALVPNFILIPVYNYDEPLDYNNFVEKVNSMAKFNINGENLLSKYKEKRIEKGCNDCNELKSKLREMYDNAKKDIYEIEEKTGKIIDINNIKEIYAKTSKYSDCNYDSVIVYNNGTTEVSPLDVSSIYTLFGLRCDLKSMLAFVERIYDNLLEELALITIEGSDH